MKPGLRRWLLRSVVVVLLLGTITGVAAWLQHEDAAMVGPREIAWGREPCTHCRMLVSDRRFAAQIVLESGHALHFDDPGCLLRYLAEHPGGSSYFRHHVEDRWLTAPAVAFARVAQTPMGDGLAAVDPSTAGALSLVSAQAEVRAREGATHAGGH